MRGPCSQHRNLARRALPVPITKWNISSIVNICIPTIVCCVWYSLELRELCVLGPLQTIQSDRDHRAGAIRLS